MRLPPGRARRAGRLERAARGLLRLPQTTCTTSRGTTRSSPAASSRTAPRRGRWCPGTVPQLDRRDAAPGGDVTVLLTGTGGGREATKLPFPLDRRGPRTRAAALPHLLHAVPRRARRRPGHDRQARVHAAPAVHQRRLLKRAAGPLLRGHHARSRGDVLLCLARPAARPLGDRGLHPGLAARPARRGRGPARRGPAAG